MCRIDRIFFPDYLAVDALFLFRCLVGLRVRAFLAFVVFFFIVGGYADKNCRAGLMKTDSYY